MYFGDIIKNRRSKAYTMYFGDIIKNRRSKAYTMYFGDIIKNRRSKAYTMYSKSVRTMMKCTCLVPGCIKTAGDTFQTQSGQSHPW